MKPLLFLAPALLLAVHGDEPDAGSAFKPERLFAGEVKEDGTDALILTIEASARDGLYPAYSLALAYRCTLPAPDAKQMDCSHTVRMLRVVKLGVSIGPSIALHNAVRKSRTQAEAIAAFDRAKLEWVEADFWKCEGASKAFDALRAADWSPDLHYTMREPDNSIVLHPAIITVTMNGDAAQSRYSGYVFNAGVPAAAEKLVEVLEPCWQPAKSPPPWRRPGKL